MRFFFSAPISTKALVGSTKNAFVDRWESKHLAPSPSSLRFAPIRTSPLPFRPGPFICLPLPTYASFLLHQTGHSVKKKITNKLAAIVAAAKAIARPASTVCDLSLLSYTLGLTRRAAALLRVRPLLDSISRRLILHSFTMILPALLKGHEPPNKKKKIENTTAQAAEASKIISLAVNTRDACLGSDVEITTKQSV